MSFEPRPGQDKVLAASEAVVVVLGGAGTGKTTTAAAVVRRELDAARSARKGPRRALFLSFSRAAVSQILDRTTDALGDQAPLVEVTTFHAFSWRLVRRFGAVIGLDDPKLISPSEAKLFGTSGGVTYDDLIPMALQLTAIPAVRAHLRKRWAIIASDEFQDTSSDQFELITRIRGDARLLFLGDLNQCIYSSLPGVVGVGPQRVDAALALPGAVRIDLPEVSHRDPTNILPAAASAIRRRDFEHAAVEAALDTRMLEIRHTSSFADEGPAVAELVSQLLVAGYESVGIFSHHVDSTAALSDHLNAAGIAHEIVGLPDAVTSALEAQFEMLCLSAGEGDPALIRRALGVFVTSVERGKAPPALARMIIGQVPALVTLMSRLEDLESALIDAGSVVEALRIVSQVPDGVGLVRGGRAWASGFQILRSLLGPRLCRATAMPAGGFEIIRDKLAAEQVALLTSSDVGDPADVQLMGLYQSKGREADATIVVLRGNDYFGREVEPMPNGSKLLYVVLTRARRKTVVLTLGSPLPSLIYPVALLAQRRTVAGRNHDQCS